MTPKKLVTNNNQNYDMSNFVEALTKVVMDCIAKDSSMQAMLEASDDPGKLVVDMVKDFLCKGANYNG